MVRLLSYCLLSYLSDCCARPIIVSQEADYETRKCNGHHGLPRYALFVYTLFVYALFIAGHESLRGNAAHE
jgi:hypothetical protein